MSLSLRVPSEVDAVCQISATAAAATTSADTLAGIARQWRIALELTGVMYPPPRLVR